MKRFNIILILVLALSISSCKYFQKSKMFSKNVDTLLDAETEMKVAADTQAVDTFSIETIVQETEAITEPVSSEPGLGYSSDKYYMVVGSFLSEQLAYKYATKMQDMGYKPQVIYSSSAGYYRVSAKSYTDYAIAINDITNFRDNVSPRAWVHVKK